MLETKHHEAFNDLMRRVQAQVSHELDRCSRTEKWGIYGAGRIGRKLANALRSKGKAVEFFLDASANAPTQLLGIPCMRKEDALESMKGARVVVALHNPGANALLVRRQLQAQGFRDVVLLQDVVDYVPDVSNFWLAPRHLSLKAEKTLSAGLSLMGDETSRRTYLSVLAYRLLGEPAPEPEGKQYFPDSLPPPPVPLRFVDVGAYDGDTLDFISEHGIAMEWCMAFEPDTANYAKLSAKHSARGMIIPCGLSNSTGDVRFTSDGSAGRMGEGDTVIRTVELDTVLANQPVNFIKMDIEGAEPAALEGSRGTIARWQPRLAIASYHDPLHMAALPAQLRSLGFTGTFHLRTHAHNTFETVLYGLPSISGAA